MAQELLKKEILFQADLEKLIGERPFEKQTTYEAFTNGKEVEKKNPDEIKADNDIEELKSTIKSEVAEEESTEETTKVD